MIATRNLATLLIIGVFVGSCNLPADVFEKNVTIPDQAWESTFKPEISFTIQDTASIYDVYLVVRHTDAYHFNNLWVKVSVQEPGSAAAKSGQYNLTLATNEKGWLGSAMDDVYEDRVLIQPKTKFNIPGIYNVTLEQIMREDPLRQVLNMGVRVVRLGP